MNKKIFFIVLLLVLILVIVYFFMIRNKSVSFDENDPVWKKRMEHVQEKISKTNEQYRAGLGTKFLNGFPLSQATVQDMYSNFDLGYELGFIRPNGSDEFLNQNTIENNTNLKIKVSELVTRFSIDSVYNENEGIALFYTLRKNNMGKKYFTYAVCKAIYDPIVKLVRPIQDQRGLSQVIIPTVDSFETYYLTRTSLDSTINMYQNIVKLREFQRNSVYTAAQIMNDLGKGHPTNCFYSDEEIYHFWDDNKDTSFNPDKFYLLFRNGAVQKQYSNLVSFKVQTPILIFEYNDSSMCNEGAIIRTRPYYYKALDVGRLCPPQCD